MRQKGFAPVIIILIFSLIGISVYALYSKGLINIPINNQVVQTNTSSKVCPTQEPIKQPSKWSSAQYGVIKYDYPTGWHVAEIWGAGLTNTAIIIGIDPKPISNAPRGGPLATFSIGVQSGLQNPEEEFIKEKAMFNTQNYYNIESEELSSDIGTIYHFKGKMAGEMMRGTQVENYYLMVKLADNNKINWLVINASYLGEDITKSEMLKHIVLSIKKINI